MKRRSPKTSDTDALQFPIRKSSLNQIDKVVHFGDAQEVRSAEKYSRPAANRDQHHEQVLPIGRMWMPEKEKG
jgi:hypothetical protein